MAAKPKPMNQIKQILRLHSLGVPVKRIARELGVARNTVRRYVSIQNSSPHELAELDEVQFHEHATAARSHTERQRRLEYIRERHHVYRAELQRTGVTRMQLWADYRLEQPHGYGYSQFCLILGQLDKAGKVTMAQLPHEAGDQAYIDFAGKPLSYTDVSTGECIEAPVLVVTLGHSQYTYVQAVPDQTTESFVNGLSRALEYFGGVPRLLIPDNLKAAVVRSDRYEPTLNHVFADFADHYRTAALPTRSRRPRDKALVENAVQQVYRNVHARLRDAFFPSLEQLNEAIAGRLREWMDRPMARRGASRRECFEATERRALQPLPTSRFQIRKYRDLTVGHNSHIELREDRHYYSVPHAWVGRVVQVRYTHDHVHVYGEHALLAVHGRDRRPNRYTTVADHLPSAHGHWLKRSPHYYRQWAEGVGPDVALFVKRVFEQARHPEHAYRRCDGLMALQRKTPAPALEAAVDLALRLDVCSLSFVRNALSSGMATAPPPEPMQGDLPAHANVRGSSYYQ